MNTEKRWMTVKEAARYLSLHPRTIYNLCARGSIPHVRVKGIGLRVDQRKLDKFLEEETEIGNYQ